MWDCMILTTASGAFAIPPSVAERLPRVPPIPDPTEPDYKRRHAEFSHWLDASADNAVDFERLRRWHLVQEQLAAAARVAGQPYTVTDDGLE